MGILDSISKNPSFLALAALGIGLFIFRDKISDFFSNITGGVEGAASVAALGGRASEGLNVQLDNLDNFFKSVENFEFPKFEFPTFTPNEEIDVIPDFSGRGTRPPVDTSPTIFPTDTIPLDPNRPLNLAQLVNQFTQPTQENFNVQTDVEGNQFGGGGLSFIGGTVRETPITGESTLGFIIDKLGVTASQAADIRAQERGFTPTEQAFLNQGQEISPLGDLANQPQTSGGFEGLTPQEIALRLTGGIISNF